MMSDKGLNFFDECASECVHLYSGRIEYFSFFLGRGDNKCTQLSP